MKRRRTRNFNEILKTCRIMSYLERRRKVDIEKLRITYIKQEELNIEKRRFELREMQKSSQIYTEIMRTRISH